MNKPAKSAAPRSDGLEAREHLLHAALMLFAEKGFSKTSTREIAKAAQANVAAISYYFGDKAGLYRAVLSCAMGSAEDYNGDFENLSLSLREALHLVLAEHTEPLKQGDLAMNCMRLHFREFLEPTGAWDLKIDGEIRCQHEALVRLLCRHLKLKAADDDVHRLAFSITGLGLQLWVCSDVMTALKPGLIKTPKAVDVYTQRLLDYAMDMVAGEAARRGATPRATRGPSTPTSTPSASAKTPSRGVSGAAKKPKL